MFLPFEFHVTVNTDDIDGFKKICSELGVKAIVIDLQDQSGNSVMRDVMTSSKHFGDDNTAISEVHHISNTLIKNGFNVVRQKIESVPWHPSAPRRENTTPMPESCYFECHFAVIVENDNGLDQIAKDHDLHKSRNVFKTYQNGKKIIMFTSRSYDGTYEDFNEKIEAIKLKFTQLDYEIEKVIIEFSVFDTRVTHDNIWFDDRIPSP